MRGSGLRSIGPYCAKSTFGHGGKPANRCRRRRRCAAAASARFTKPCTSSRVTRPCGPLPLSAVQIDAEFAREPPNRRDSHGRCRSRLALVSSRASALCAAVERSGAGVAVGARRRCALRRCARGDSACTRSSVAMTVPCETLSPALTLTSCDRRRRRWPELPSTPFRSRARPAALLSQRVSPGLTSTSMTGTSLKSPMSGTVSSMMFALVRDCAPAGYARSVGSLRSG